MDLSDKYIDKHDQYLKELKELERIKNYREARKEYKKEVEDLRLRSFSYFASPKTIDKRSRKLVKKGSFLENSSTAYALMEKAVNEGAPRYALVAAKMYENMGKGSKAIPKLLRAIEKTTNDGPRNNDFYTELNREFYSEVKAFIERNETKTGVTLDLKRRGIESRVAVFMFFILGGLVLSTTSIRATGNVIGSLTGTTQGLLGVFLFVFGLAGLVFGLGRNK